MKRERVQELQRQELEKRQKTQEWIRLVERYKSDAVRELAGIVGTGAVDESALVLHTSSRDLRELDFELQDVAQDQSLIYMVNNEIYYGPDMIPYPVESKDRWPRTVPDTRMDGNRMPRGVLWIIARYCQNPYWQTPMKLRLVCKRWRNCLDADTILWSRMYSRLIVGTSMTPPALTFQGFRDFYYFDCQTPDPNVCHRYARSLPRSRLKLLFVGAFFTPIKVEWNDAAIRPPKCTLYLEGQAITGQKIVISTTSRKRKTLDVQIGTERRQPYWSQVFHAYHNQMLRGRWWGGSGLYTRLLEK